ncbi:type II toxin-antitoxin system toxin DNA ADP-ribosyl transferase DarT [Methylomagnum sp.]
MPPNPTSIYHITPLENLRQIFQAGGLLAKRALDQEDAGYTNIAHQTIQDRRAQTPVPCGPGGVLQDYVPFYFAPRSPMLYTLSRGNVEGFTGGQGAIVYLVSTAQTVQAAGLDFVFSDGHGIMAITDFYDDLAHLNAVDWPLMRANYWADTDDDLDRKRRRQAEFLVHERFPVELIQNIGVIDPIKKQEAEILLAEFGFTMPVAIQRGWYY